MIMGTAVYIITNKANGKQYVGISKNLTARWYKHRGANGSAPALHAAIIDGSKNA